MRSTSYKSKYTERRLPPPDFRTPQNDQVRRVCARTAGLRPFGPMRRTVLIFLGTFGAAACGDSPAFTCSRPEGLWLLETTQRGGTCGELPDVLNYLGPTAAKTSACVSVTYDWSPDSCAFEAELVDCDDGGALLSQSMTMTQRSSTAWTGVIDTSVRTDDGRTCRSTYDATATKQ